MRAGGATKARLRSRFFVARRVVRQRGLEKGGTCRGGTTECWNLEDSTRPDAVPLRLRVAADALDKIKTAV
jgi:hypothetical protein